MFRLIVRHFNLLVLTLLVLSVVSFSLTYLFPGDPLVNLSGEVIQTDTQRQALEEKYKFNESYVSQYIQYVALLFNGDWGISLSSGLSLWEEILHSLPASIELASYALILSLLIGIPLGFIAGLNHNKSTDYSLLTLSVIGYSTPVFWMALLMILVFSLQLGWLPLSGRISLLFDIPHVTGFILLDIWISDVENKSAVFANAIQHMVMPVLSVTIVTSAIILRLTRRSVIEVMPKGFIQAAYSRGLSHYQVFIRHGMRNSLLPILPLLAMQTTTLFTNAMIVEVIYSWPGIGDWLIQAIYQRDYPAIRAGMLAVSALVVSLTVSIDLFAKLIDPTRDKRSRVSI